MNIKNKNTMNKINEEKAKKKLVEHIFADLSHEEIDEFKKYASLVVSNLKLVSHVTCKDKPKIKSVNYIKLSKKYNLEILITDFSDIESVKNGWKNIYIFKNEVMRGIILEAEKLDRKSDLYHFVQGKIFSYSDNDIVNFIANFNQHY